MSSSDHGQEQQLRYYDDDNVDLDSNVSGANFFVQLWNAEGNPIMRASDGEEEIAFEAEHVSDDSNSSRATRTTTVGSR